MSDGTTKKTRETRTNHAPAKANPITDTASAQRFCDAAIEATRNSPGAAGFNASGFVTPEILKDQSVENRLRMASSLIHSLADTVGEGGEDGTAAADALGIIGDYSKFASAEREKANNEKILAQADAIRARQTATV